MSNITMTYDKLNVSFDAASMNNSFSKFSGRQPCEVNEFIINDLDLSAAVNKEEEAEEVAANHGNHNDSVYQKPKIPQINSKYIKRSTMTR